jgi:BirA family transcriptional regulator, biotin operon repressor / biotin---[acetyl-CoA-carboxylase] ligase
VSKISFIPFPEPKDLPRWLHWVETCPSTNTWALDRASDFIHGDVIFTRHQTSGRGQHGRIWHSPPGVLTASFVGDRVLREQLPGLSLAAGLAVIYAVEDLLPILGEQLQLKWTNDVWLEGRKLAGILCEATASDRHQTRVIVGIGLNRCVDFDRSGLEPSAIGNAISLHQVSNLIIDELILLERLRYYLLQAIDVLCYKSLGLAALLPELRRRDGLVNRQITVELSGTEISGQATGLDESGRLLLRLPDGGWQAFSAGRVVKWD